MADTDDSIEQTLHISRSVDVFQIPPRAPTGWKSGEWLVANKIFSGRLRVISRNQDCEIRLEEANSGELFACCPIAYGMRTICVEPVTDSSRYFVLRVEDPSTKRHAFLGMGFAQRGEAFDFNESLVRHEKWVERERAAATIQASTSSAPAAGATAAAPASTSSSGRGPSQTLQAAAANKEVASLYAHHGNLGLQEGQTITVNLKPKPATKSSWLTSGPTIALPTPSQTPSGVFKLAPPPADISSPAAQPSPGSFGGQHTTAPQQPMYTHTVAQAGTGPTDLLGGWTPAQPPAGPTVATPAQAAPPTDWAVFD